MAKRKDKDIANDAKTGRFVLGSDRFAKISEVEGIRLTPEMKKRASAAKSKGLTAEEYRQMIMRSHQKRSSRMYDAIEDPYTYKNSTVLVNKLGLENQAELDAFEAEISNASAEEPLPDGILDFGHYRAMHHHLFQDVYQWAGRVSHGKNLEGR